MPDVTKNNFTSNKHPIITTTNFFSIYIWCTAIIVIISVLLHLRIGLNNDTMTLMHQTYKMLAGGKPYVDFVDVNPPLIHYLFTIPLIFSQATGIKLYVALNLFATIIAALSLCVVAGVLRGGGTKKATRTLTISSLALALLSISFMHQLFADREWLLTTLITPLLVLYSPLVTRETVSKRWYVATVLMACIGFCLKPYALTLYAAALLYRPISGQPLHNIFHEKISYIIINIIINY